MKKDELVNMVYNSYISNLSDNDENPMFESTYYKKVPYIGWFWRDIDVIKKDVSIGNCGDFIGIIENNKWEYPDRYMTEEEVDILIGYIDKTMEVWNKGGQASELVLKQDTILKELCNWMQTLKI